MYKNPADSLLDLFEDHLVNFHTISDLPIRNEMLDLKYPGREGYRRIIYTYMGRTLHVQGDWGDASYWWSEIHDLRWIADCDFGYFHSKCRSSPVGFPYNVWSEKETKRLFTQHIDSKIKNSVPADKRDKILNKCMIIFERRGLDDHADCRHDWQHWVRVHDEQSDYMYSGWDHESRAFLEAYLEPGYLFDIDEIGIVPHPWSVIHLAGLRWWVQNMERERG